MALLALVGLRSRNNCLEAHYWRRPMNDATARPCDGIDCIYGFLVFTVRKNYRSILRQ